MKRKTKAQRMLELQTRGDWKLLGRSVPVKAVPAEVETRYSRTYGEYECHLFSLDQTKPRKKRTAAQIAKAQDAAQKGVLTRQRNELAGVVTGRNGLASRLGQFVIAIATVERLGGTHNHEPTILLRDLVDAKTKRASRRPCLGQGDVARRRR
jgi:hypothetical protein